MIPLFTLVLSFIVVFLFSKDQSKTKQNTSSPPSSYLRSERAFKYRSNWTSKIEPPEKKRRRPRCQHDKNPLPAELQRKEGRKEGRGKAASLCFEKAAADKAGQRKGQEVEGQLALFLLFFYFYSFFFLFLFLFLFFRKWRREKWRGEWDR